MNLVLIEVDLRSLDSEDKCDMLLELTEENTIDEWERAIESIGSFTGRLNYETKYF